LISGYKRRRLVVAAAIWLLRLLLDVEKEEMWRYSDLIDNIDSGAIGSIHQEYQSAEDAYILSELAVSVLESAIFDIEIAY